MKCEKCGKEFPHKKGRYCGTCNWNCPNFKMPEKEHTSFMRPTMVEFLGTNYEQRIEELERANASLQQQSDSGVNAKMKLKIAQEYIAKYQNEIKMLHEALDASEAERKQLRRECDELQDEYNDLIELAKANNLHVTSIKCWCNPVKVQNVKQISK